MRRSTTSLSRLLKIRRVIKKHGLIDLLDRLELSKGARFASRLLFKSQQLSEVTSRGLRIRLALEDLGPVFIKFGQALSTRPDLLPADIALELTKLQDQVPPFDGDQALNIIKEAYGEQYGTIFDSVEKQALASASVAQVHAATLQKGLAIEGQNGLKSDQVIIKVLRPGIRETINQDLSVMHLFANLLDKYWRSAAQFKPREVIAEYEGTIIGELDLRQEAANCSQMGANFEQTDIIYVPRVYWDYSQREVMVMERIYGTTVGDVEQLKSLGYDLKQLAEDGVETFFKQAFEDNFFHADMHPGNIFVSDKGKWIAIDFGIMGVLNNHDKRYLAEMLLGFFNRDYHLIAQSHAHAGWIPDDTKLIEFEAAIRMVCEPNFAKPISEISFGTVLLQLFQTVRRFNMPVQPQLVLLYKTLLNIEGLGRQLYPELNLWDTAKPFLENWMKEQLSPQAILSDIKRDWPQWRNLLAELPQHVQRMHEQAKQPDQLNTQLLEQIELLSAKNHLIRFHQIVGFGMASVAAGVILADQYEIITNPSVRLISPWLLGLGLVWAYIHSKRDK